MPTDPASNRFVELLLLSGELLGESLDYQETLRNVAAAAVRTIADICMIDMVDHRGGIELLASAHRDPARHRALQEAARFRHAASGFPADVGVTALRSGKAKLFARVDDDFMRDYATSPEHEQFMRTMHFHSLIVAPLASRRYGTIGTLTVVRTEFGEPPFGEEDVRFVVDLARRCATAITKALLHEQTLDIATRFQLAAMPKHLPAVPGLRLDAFYEPASTGQLVGGDWYDAFEIDEECIGITIGDVQGHGVDAAVLMNSMRDALRAALAAGASADRALTIGDTIMQAEGGGSFATALIALIHVSHCRLTVASAGHQGPLIWRSGSKRVEDAFADRSLPLGMQQAFGIRQSAAKRIYLKQSDFVVFFTDGLVEWQHDPEAGERALAEALHDRSIREARKPAGALRRALVTGPTRDDLAVLTVAVD